MFLLVPAHPGSPGQRAAKRLLFCCYVLQVMCYEIVFNLIMVQFNDFFSFLFPL